MARTKKVRFREEPSLSEAIYRFDPSQTYISLHSNHAVKVDRIKKRARRQSPGVSDIDADINAAYLQINKRPSEEKTAHTQVYELPSKKKTAYSQVTDRPSKKKTAYSQVTDRPSEKKTSYTPQDSDYPVYYGLLPSEIHQVATATIPDRPQKIQPAPAAMTQKAATPAQVIPKKIQPVPAAMPQKAAVPAQVSPKKIKPVPAAMTQKAAVPAQVHPKKIQPAPTAMPQKTAAPSKESRRERTLSAGISMRHTSTSKKEKTAALMKDLAGRFDGISLNMNTIALVTSILAVILFLFIGYVTISVFRDRSSADRGSRVPVESSVSSQDEELPEYCPRLTLITHSVTIKAGDHFSPLNYIGTMSDDTDTQETLSHNVMLIGYDKVDESKKGTYQLGYYILDSDGNQSNVEYLDIVIH